MPPTRRITLAAIAAAAAAAPAAARMTEPPLRLSPELRIPPVRSWTTHVEVGTSNRARTWNYSLNITSGRSSNPIVHS
jgi:hypothetical protein